MAGFSKIFKVVILVRDARRATIVHSNRFRIGVESCRLASACLGFGSLCQHLVGNEGSLNLAGDSQSALSPSCIAVGKA